MRGPSRVLLRFLCLCLRGMLVCDCLSHGFSVCAYEGCWSVTFFSHGFSVCAYEGCWSVTVFLMVSPSVLTRDAGL